MRSPPPASATARSDPSPEDERAQARITAAKNIFDAEEIIDAELQLKDLDSVDKKIQKVVRAAKSGDAKAKKELASLEKYKAHLEAGLNARSLDATEEDKEAVDDLKLLVRAAHAAAREAGTFTVR